MRIERIEIFVTDLTTRLQRQRSTGAYDTGVPGALTGKPVLVKVFAEGDFTEPRWIIEGPNGDLFLEGTKVVLINNEEYHLYTSGLVRRADIGQDNTVFSSRIADAQVEFTGRGDIADQNRKGWFARTIDSLNPF